VTSAELAPTLRFARRLSDRGNPMWVRYVLVPGLTDAADDVEKVARFTSTLAHVERVEVLPFHGLAGPNGVVGMATGSRGSRAGSSSRPDPAGAGP
jgi:pyruvate formate lyase activating enzyme